MVSWGIEIPAQIIVKSPAARGQIVKRTSQTDLPDHEPGRLRDIVERTGGAVAAVMKVPTNLVSGTLVGAYQGFRKGRNPNYKISPEATAIGQVALNTIQGSIGAGVTGFVVGGPVGAATNMALDAASASAGIYVFVKNGSAREIGLRLSEAIDTKVAPGQGALSGSGKGAVAGGVTAVKGAASTGFREGKGLTSGILEGLKEVPQECREFKAPKGGLLKGAFKAVIGVVGACLSVPAGLGLSLLIDPEDESKTVPLGKRLLVNAATGAAAGLAAGFTFGPVGWAVGATAGATLSLLGPASRNGFVDQLQRSLARAVQDDTNLGSEIANKNRNMGQALVTGGISSIKNGWNSAQS